MTEDPHEDEYLDLFRPKPDESDEEVAPPPEPFPGSANPRRAEQGQEREASGVERGAQWEHVPPGRAREAGADVEFERVVPPPGAQERNVRLVGAILGGGCLLLMLVAVVAFAFIQVFLRRGDDRDVPPTPASTVVVVSTAVPSPTVTVDSSRLDPLVSSSEVRVPFAMPVHLTIGERSFAVQAVGATPGFWPPAPETEDTANWTYGTLVNYIFGLAPTGPNRETLSALAVDEVISLRTSTGVILEFKVNEVLTGLPDEAALFEQVSPGLTVGLLNEDPAQRIVVTADFFNDQLSEDQPFAGAAVGLVGNPLERSPVRVTVLEVYQAAAEAAGLPAGTGYLLLDIRVENIAETVLVPGAFQSFVSSPTGERFPLTLLAEQFTHYGMPPADPLAPGETLFTSLGYLVPDVEGNQARWMFNPVPGSDNWIIVPVSYEFPAPQPATPETPPAGFARVTVDTDDVFVNREDGLLDIGLRIENISEGVVQVTANDIRLTSSADGEVPLVAPAPPLPWMIEAGELRLFQLQFRLPSADSALLTVSGYSFSIENLGGE